MEISMPYPHNAVKSRVRVDQLVVRPRDFASEVEDWLGTTGLLTIAALITVAWFVLL
jgi:hypothetical protein